jgi:enoyl-CoA hydratase
MTDKLLLTRQTNGVAIITLNRPEALNALSLDMMPRLAQMIATLAQDADLRVVIITGAGEKAFSSGGDLTQLKDKVTEADGAYLSRVMSDALLALERLPVPVIAAINGYALGGGSEIALACDLRVVDDKVRFGLVQIKMGLTPGWGAGQRLLRLVGYARALEILLRGQPMTAADLVTLGLATQVAPTGQALSVALLLANEIATADASVVRAIKRLLQAAWQQPYEQALQTEHLLFAPLWAAEPHWQAVQQFINRQKTND